MKLDMVHSFACSREDYEKNINHPELLKMCDGRLPYLKSRVLVESKEGPGPDQLFFRFRCEADYKMPEAARKILGENFGWFEESVFDRKQHAIRFKVIPDLFKGRYRCEGDQNFVERDDGGCDRLMTIDLEVGIPIVGRLVEKHILERLKETYEVELAIQGEFYSKLRSG
jgi:Protein of unknown function (DUF2505)